jgi:hypothetical protein
MGFLATDSDRIFDFCPYQKVQFRKKLWGQVDILTPRRGSIHPRFEASSRVAKGSSEPSSLIR